MVKQVKKFDLKTRLRNKALWVSILAFIPVVCKNLGIDIIPSNYEDLVNSLLTFLVLGGILNNPTQGNWYADHHIEEIKKKDKKIR